MANHVVKQGFKNFNNRASREAQTVEHLPSKWVGPKFKLVDLQKKNLVNSVC
jgi:hypothetical protein